MYQFYYSNKVYANEVPRYQQNLNDYYEIRSIRPTMWEEHCLECSAPLCYSNCSLYKPRIDGRCKRFYDGFFVYNNPNGCCNQGMHIKFRKWSNMMTIIFPGFLDIESYNTVNHKNEVLGNALKSINNARIPIWLKWNITRVVEYIRRCRLRNNSSHNGNGEVPDAFIFQCFSNEKSSFHLILEVFSPNNAPVFRKGIEIQPGENVVIIPASQLDSSCWRTGNLIKVYPENNIEAELDVLWCDFVRGEERAKDKPSAKVKCLVWDLDNTLWNGILIETENKEQLIVPSHIKDIIKQLDERGIIQSIASKNEYADAWSVIEYNGLSEYFLYPQIHWNAKTNSIRTIAEELNIGIDSIALIDDSSFERNQVRTFLPQVRTYDVTEIQELLKKDEFDVQITLESKKRREMYKAEEKRKTLKQHNDMDTVEFLKICEMKVELFAPKSKEELERCYELILRTNQLNMSGKKYDRTEFNKRLELSDIRSFAFASADKFGEYGIVGFGQYSINDGVIDFTEFAMSCRVAGKYVESAVFSYLLERENCNYGLFKVIKTKKNVLLRNTLQKIGFIAISEDNAQITYRFDKELEYRSIVEVSERING